ncbi:hypothetical protein HYQ46_011490 [Verticillium longisporum]|nr:hypothetical protein HYQ46_011490 [Verticillium longisporum]
MKWIDVVEHKCSLEYKCSLESKRRRGEVVKGKKARVQRPGLYPAAGLCHRSPPPWGSPADEGLPGFSRLLFKHARRIFFLFSPPSPKQAIRPLDGSRNGPPA